MLRLFRRNLIFNAKSPGLFSSAKNIRIIALSPRQHLSNLPGGDSRTQESSDRDPEKVKRAKLLDVLIISSIGIIGFGYLIVRRAFTDQVQAKSVEGLTEECGGKVENGIDSDGERPEPQMPRKKRKTFKETRVSF